MKHMDPFGRLIHTFAFNNKCAFDTLGLPSSLTTYEIINFP